MEYAILDLEYADVVLPSFLKISIVKFKNRVVTERREFLFNPECDIDPNMKAKYKIDDISVESLPTIRDEWFEIRRLLKGSNVFIFGAVEKVDALNLRASIDHLMPPDFRYICLRSLVTKSLGIPNRPRLEELNMILDLNRKNRLDILIDIVNLVLDKEDPLVFEDLIESTKASNGILIQGYRTVSKEELKALEEVYVRNYL